MAKGCGAMRQPYAPLFAQSPKTHCEIPKRIAVGQYVIDEEHVTGFNLKGHPSERRAAAVYRISDEKVNPRSTLLLTC